MSQNAPQPKTLHASAISGSRIDLDVSQAPDPEPGWATRHPDRAWAFLYMSPRPCAALEELMRL